MRSIMRLRWLLLTVVLPVWLSACQDAPDHTASTFPESIEPGELCHLCGMIITHFPGPKGQVFVPGHGHSLKFCSTLELFAWLLQPENKPLARAVFVHDMATTNWENPNDQAFIDARTAWYVWGHTRHGSMGRTLASFNDRADALAFARQFRGDLYRYQAITLEMVVSSSAFPLLQQEEQPSRTRTTRLQ